MNLDSFTRASGGIFAYCVSNFVFFKITIGQKIIKTFYIFVVPKP